MAAISKHSEIVAINLKNRIKEIINSLLPSNSNSWNYNNVPDSQMQFMLSDHDVVYNEACSYVDNEPTIVLNLYTNVQPVFNLLKNVFTVMGRCRRVYYQNAQSYPGPGTQDSPETIASNTGATSGGGTLTYFATSFSLSGNYASPAAQANCDTNVTGFKTIPSWGTNNWNNNTNRLTGTAQLNTMTVNQIIKAVEGIEQQMTNFKNEWNNRNNASGWWSGNANDSSSNSNRLFFVRYWCHGNCHSDCHSSCHGSRGRR